MKTEFYTWLKGIGEKQTDYLFWSKNIYIKELLKSRSSLWQPKYEYDQSAQYESRNYCTIYSAVTELSYLWDYEFTYCQIQEIANKMIEDWKLDPNMWAYLSDAIDYTRKWWNKNFPKKTVSSYQISYLDEELRNILIHDVWRLTQIGYRTSTELHKELQTNGFAMKKDYPKEWGHAVSQYWLNIIDNYKNKNKFNRYSFHYFYDLVKNWIIFEKWYLFLKN